MRNTILIILLVASILPLSGCSQTPEKKGAGAKVLFIGNSYTSSGELPEMFTQLARSGGHDVHAEMIVQGGWMLQQHAATPSTLDTIKNQKWDYVVLQEQSLVPSVEQSRVLFMYPAIRDLNNIIASSGARTILFMTWGRKNGMPEYNLQNYTDMQAQLNTGYTYIGNEQRIILAPVGPAWQQTVEQDQIIQLWQGDGSHPSRSGTFLAACVFYATIFKESPEVLSFNSDIPAAHAVILKSIAAKTVLTNPATWNN